ncbi:MAG: hypothetical protein LBN22_01145 [Clostridiales Family XIII bacterium]|jgi:hypothetical protein|nr:hypothetical protein [Clostridiales Family XIII bacterium]
MPIILLGLIAIGIAVAYVLISIGKRPAKPNALRDNSKNARARSAAQKKHHKTSEDGKVVYMFDPDDDTHKPDGDGSSDK